MPRGVVSGIRPPPQDAGPFGGNRGRHGPQPHRGSVAAAGLGAGGVDDSDRSSLSHSQGVSPSSSSKRGISRSSTMSDVSWGKGTGRDTTRERGRDTRRVGSMPRTGAGAGPRGSGASASVRASVSAWGGRHEARVEEDEEDAEDDGGGGAGSDSENEDEDSMSTMDVDALRREMGKRRSREVGMAVAKASGGSTVEYMVEFEVCWLSTIIWLEGGRGGRGRFLHSLCFSCFVAMC